MSENFCEISMRFPRELPMRKIDDDNKTVPKCPNLMVPWKPAIKLGMTEQERIAGVGCVSCGVWEITGGNFEILGIY